MQTRSALDVGWLRRRRESVMLVRQWTVSVAALGVWGIGGTAGDGGRGGGRGMRRAGRRRREWIAAITPSNRIPGS